MREHRFSRVSPTAGLAGLLFVMAAMWYAAASQNNAAAYLLLFCLTSVFLISIPHTLLNLAGLKATAESVKPTFAGTIRHFINSARLGQCSRTSRPHPRGQSRARYASILRATSRRTRDRKIMPDDDISAGLPPRIETHRRAAAVSCLSKTGRRPKPSQSQHALNTEQILPTARGRRRFRRGACLCVG